MKNDELTRLSNRWKLICTQIYLHGLRASFCTETLQISIFNKTGQLKCILPYYFHWLLSKNRQSTKVDKTCDLVAGGQEEVVD